MKSIFFRICALIIILSMSLSACSSKENVAVSDKKRDKSPQISEEDLSSLVDGNNAFAVDIYNALRSNESGNLILSPYSLSATLAMAYAGADSETANQMGQVMHYLPQEQLHPAFNALDLALKKKPESLSWWEKPMQLNIANSIWAEQVVPILPEYLDTIAINYGAGVHLADFQNNTDQARAEINKWISEATDGQFQGALPDGALDDQTSMVLVNAIYFKGDWLKEFTESHTRNSPFHLLDETEITVSMMSEELENIPYFQSEGYQIIELPYRGKTIAMDIILPEQGTFENFESTFNKDVLDEAINGLQEVSTAQVSIPKFKFNKELDLSATLEDLGVKDAFDKDNADFSGIATITEKRRLYIKKILQNAFIEVDEKGTKAGSISFTIFVGGGARMPDVSFVADHPFLFIIRDTVNGQILFIGRVLNPNEK